MWIQMINYLNIDIKLKPITCLAGRVVKFVDFKAIAHIIVVWNRAMDFGFLYVRYVCGFTKMPVCVWNDVRRGTWGFPLPVHLETTFFSFLRWYMIFYRWFWFYSNAFPRKVNVFFILFSNFKNINDTTYIGGFTW
jgi:hypothetical protein